MSMFAAAQVASAQNAGVSEEEIKCFVSACDDAKGAPDAKGDADDECMNSGICPVGETRGFHLSTSTPNAAKPANRAYAARPAAGKPARGYTGSAAKPGKLGSGSVGKMAMPASRRSLDMRLSFELASAQLTPQAKAQADVFARTIKEGAGAREFVIEGHTDSIGSAASNRQLSRERAQSVVNYLVSQGVPASKLRAVGYGFDHPRDGTTAADPSNRRVEIVRY
jgi:OOP family OmpA-OmpF porin